MNIAYTLLLSICLLFSLCLPKLPAYKQVNQPIVLTDEELDSIYYDYHVDITDSFTIVYDNQGKFVTTVPFVEGSKWDEAMIRDNL